MTWKTFFTSQIHRPPSIEEFKILSSCQDIHELLIHESLLISEIKPFRAVQSPFSYSNLFVFVCPFLFCVSLHLYIHR